MPSSSSFLTPRTLFFGALVLALGTAIAVRLLPAQPPLVTSSSSAVAAPDTAGSSAASGLPAFTSASFETGDVLTSLGPEWTVMRQDDQIANAASPLAGLSLTRETLVHLTGASSTLMITEATISDAAALAKDLKAQKIPSVMVAGRSGYLAAVPSLVGGSAFVMTGSSTALLLQYDEDPYGNLMDWPKDVPAAIQSYISAVKVY